MSGNPSGSNVVPMPHALAPASNPAQPPMPFPMWGGGGSLPWGPGCCPPGGMDALMKCYCDVQAATAFICSVMVQCVQNNPAVTDAIIAAIEKSGSSLPLTGVTNGQAAQPGQVGEYVQLIYNGNFVTGTNNQVFSAGVLQPGDWMITPWAMPNVPLQFMYWVLNPIPAGASNGLVGYLSEPTPAGTVQLVVGQSGQLLTSVPTLLAFNLETTATGSAAFVFALECWRMR